LAVFDEKWFKQLYCLLARLGEVDMWVFHRIVYDLSRSGLIEVNNWTWYGDSPRSAEVDAALALLEMIGVVEVSDGRVKLKYRILGECSSNPVVESVVEKALSSRAS